MTTEIDISFEYLNREKSKGNDVEQWIRDYARRNKIKLEVRPYSGRRYADESFPQLVLRFRSEWQSDCFVRQGNRQFPYFEFI